MRYGIQHNVHKKNEKSDFTRQPKDMNEFLGNPLKTQSSGTHAPLLEEGYSYQGGEGMRAVGEVGVSQRYGGGRDGTHHKMERRMVYEEVPEAPEMGEPTQPPAAEEPKPPFEEAEQSEDHQQSEAEHDQHFEDGNPWDATSATDSYESAFARAVAAGREMTAGDYLRQRADDKKAGVGRFTDYLVDKNTLAAHESHQASMNAIDKAGYHELNPPTLIDPGDLYDRYKGDLDDI